MAINTSPGQPARHLATYNASGNFVVAAGVNSIFVSIHSSPGGGGGSSSGDRYCNACGKGGNAGLGTIAGAFVQVSPGSTYAIVCGAAGAAGSSCGCSTGGAGNAGATGGTSSFDGNTFLVTGGAGGSGGTQYNLAPGAGAAGVGSGITSLTTLPPSSAATTRVGSITTSNTPAGTAGTGGGTSGGRYTRYNNNPAPTAGSGAGVVHIYT